MKKKHHEKVEDDTTDNGSYGLPGAGDELGFDPAAVEESVLVLTAETLQSRLEKRLPNIPSDCPEAAAIHKWLGVLGDIQVFLDTNGL